MPVVREIAESIKLLGDAVKSTREIITAVNDGKAYLKHYYPDAQADLSSLLQQMQRAVEGLASVTKVISGFRFVVVGTSVQRATAARDLARLNDYLMAQREKASILKGRIRKLKADCDKVRTLRDRLEARTKAKTWGSMFQLLGVKTLQRSQKLSSDLSGLYADDQRMIGLLQDSLGLTEKVLVEVEDSLGAPGTADVHNVPIAAQVLGVYAVIFRASHDELDNLADDLDQACRAFVP